MKVIQIGSGSITSYAGLKVHLAKSENKFGNMYYFKEPIYLVQKESITGYSVFQSKVTNQPQLNLNFTDELKKEFVLLLEEIYKEHPQLKFKPFIESNLFLKFSKDCPKVQPNQMLQYSIRIYGCFEQKSTGTSYIQMEIHDVNLEKLNLLTSSINYEPNSSWNESF